MLEARQLSNVIDRASGLVNTVISKYKPETPDVHILSEKEQVDLFLNMPDEALDKIRITKGDAEYNRYINRMLEASRRYYANR